MTVVVFKDNHAARSFRVPLAWISRLGAGMGFLILGSVLISLIALKYYRKAHQGDPGRIGSLEEEIQGLRASNEVLQTRVKSAQDAAASAAAAKSVTAAPIAVPTVGATATNEPIPTPTETARGAVSVPITAGSALVFRDLPSNVTPGPADPASIPITVQMQKVAWKGKSLSVRFAIQYTGAGGGNQQGRIVILARGPSAMLSYPEQVFNAASAPVLVAPERGEYFSVSRYRETHAEFGPFPNTDLLREVDILIFGAPGGDEAGLQLLIHQRVPIEAPVAAKAPAPKAAPKPAPLKPKPETP
ncbi:MAG TPA: hypothetical protein VM598_08520, partial [Bdellovibrionota bacterium]|nr:hypothetical protein [Bdellovibrionota bacterium]